MAAHRLSLKKGWDVVGQDVCMAVHDFFTNGQLFKEVNHTFLSLIPKVVTTLLNVSDYCPISCCNVLYKCISKILTNRIIEGIKEELMHNYQRNRGPPRYAFKVDIQKAYDTVNWQFLGFILKCFGFHHTMIKWIMACVKSPSFFICINGDIHGFFKGKRGLRQVDPLFPYLFTLVMEVLTSIFQRRVRLSESFRYLKHCEELQIINVCFANELFLFARGDVESASVIMESLNEFKQVTGLVPSIPKSTTFFCNVMNHVKISILNVMPFSEGRLQLCNSVISSMQVYWASVLAIPFGITEDIQQLIRGFLWCNGEYKRGKAKVAWDDICLPKCEGGLGVRCLKMQVGNGLRTSLWYDTWCNQSPLLNFISRRDIAREGHHLLKYAWESLRPRGIEVPWYSIVWFSHCIPRHAFQLWLVMRRSLKTQDKLRPFSSKVWLLIRKLAGMDSVAPILEDIITFCCYSWCSWGFLIMERGFLANNSKEKNQTKDGENNTKKADPSLHGLAARVRNIDGKVLMNDGKPIDGKDAGEVKKPVRGAPMTDAAAIKPLKSILKKHSAPNSTVPITKSFIEVVSPNSIEKQDGRERVADNDTVLPMAAKEGVMSSVVTKVSVWVKLYNVPMVAYSKDGLSLIATQIGKPIMLDAFTSSMCVDSWGRISLARALIEIDANLDLKKEVKMAIPVDEDDRSGYISEVIRVEYEWKPPHCLDLKLFGHNYEKCPNKVIVTDDNVDNLTQNNDGFTEVVSRKNKGKKVVNQQLKILIAGLQFHKPKSTFYKKANDKQDKKKPADVKDSSSHACGDKSTTISNAFLVLNSKEGAECTEESVVECEKDSLWSKFKAAKEASKSNPRSTSDFEEESNEDEVYFPNEEYTSGMGGGFSLEEDDLDCYDDNMRLKFSICLVMISI
ncbi:hypothetical protein Tco_0428225 [Tanacetum coccineum]